MKCSICEREESNKVELRKPLIGWVNNGTLPEFICTDCLTEWYDGGHNSWEQVKRAVLKQTTETLEDVKRERDKYLQQNADWMERYGQLAKKKLALEKFYKTVVIAHAGTHDPSVDCHICRAIIELRPHEVLT